MHCFALLQCAGYRESQEWISGQSAQQEPAFLGGRSAVVWAREYSTEDARRCDCNALQEALGKISGAKRMVRCPLMLQSMEERPGAVDHV